MNTENRIPNFNLFLLLSVVFILCPHERIVAQTTNGLIARYTFDGVSGPVIDETGNFHGTNFGAARGVEGCQGNAFEFDGYNTYVNTIPAASIPTHCTISMWIHPKQGSNPLISGQICGSVDRIHAGQWGFLLHFYDNDSLASDGSQHSYRNSVVAIHYHDLGRVLAPADLFPTDTWTHLTYSYNTAGQVKIYANGILVQTGSYYAAPSIHEHALMFGKGIRSQSNGFHGKIDEVFVYNRALSDSEVMGVYQASCNQSPVADAGDDIVIECSDATTSVQLDGSLSWDPDGDPLEFEWSVPEGSGAILVDPTSPSPVGVFPVGPTLVTLTVSDGNGGIAVDDVLVTVVDTTPPVLVCSTDKIAPLAA